jgi:HPt (histidine-containing phosphotransfer) domain-containing protein
LGRAGVSLKETRAHPAPAAASAPAKPADEAALVLDQSVLNRLRQLRQPGQPDPVAELIDLFLMDMPKRIQQMDDALARQDANSLRVAAHTLKGSSKNMGAQRLAQICAELEAQSREASFTHAPQLIAAIKMQAAELTLALEAEKCR